MTEDKLLKLLVKLTNSIDKLNILHEFKNNTIRFSYISKLEEKFVFTLHLKNGVSILTYRTNHFNSSYKSYKYSAKAAKYFRRLYLKLLIKGNFLEVFADKILEDV